MTSKRTALGLLGAGTLLGLGIVAPSPAGAAAAGVINSPAENMKYAKTQTVAIGATASYGIGDRGTATLAVSDANHNANAATGCAFTVATDKYGPQLTPGQTKLNGTLDLAAAYPDSCASLAGKPAVNGAWQVVLTTADSTSTGTFVTDVPPAAPTGVAVNSPIPLGVSVTWAANAEPDTHAYAILDSSGAVVAGPSDAASLCQGNTCSATFSVSNAGAQSFAVRAYRYQSPSNTSSTTGDLTAESGPQMVTVQPAAGATAAASSGTSPRPMTSASASPAAPRSGTSKGSGSGKSKTTGKGSQANDGGTGGNSAGGSSSSGGSGVLLHPKTGGSAAARIASGFTNFAPVGGAVALPSLAGPVGGVAPASPPAADGEPTEDGTYSKSLGYQPETKRVATQVRGVAPLAFVADAVGVSSTSLLRSLAGSLVLLLAAFHVRRWARKPID